MNQLDFSRIQDASPYQMEEVSNGIYLFETDNNVLYKIESEEDAPIGGCDTYQFYINNIRHIRAERDTKVKQAVMAILVEFFRVNDSVVLYVCDTSDGRQRKRSLLFQRWFNEYRYANQFTVLFGCIQDENIDNYVGIIVERANPRYQAVIDDFNETLAMFCANKP
jgi:hypothetical protein